MTDHNWLLLTRALGQTMRSHAPGWTEGNDSDPGMTILEVIAYLAEGLQFREQAGTAGSSAAARAIAALHRLADREPVTVLVHGKPWRVVDSLADAGPDDAVFTLDHSSGEITFGDGLHGRVPESGSVVVRYRQGSQGADGNTTISVSTTWPLPRRCFGLSLRQGATQPLTDVSEYWGGPTRPNYFAGRLLGAQDLQEEQQYHRGKRRLHLQALHGSGVVRGLDVSVSSDGTSLTVAPGHAIDPHGQEIVLEKPVLIAPPSGATSPSWLVVEYAERGIDVVPIPDGEPQARRIQEGCRITLAPSPGETGVTLARVVNEGNAWRVDPTFSSARAR